MFKKSLIAVASLLAAVGTAQACSTLVIGKAVSETGNIIVAHNEDNGGRLFNMQHYVPPAKHKKGEMLKFEKFAAEIPQVEETLGFYWTQTFVPDGASFADGFFNDAGVVVATNWCGRDLRRRPHGSQGRRHRLRHSPSGGRARLTPPARQWTSRRSARRIRLLPRPGARIRRRRPTKPAARHPSGQQLGRRKIHDNEVVYIPNNFMMDKVDLNDKETWRIEPKQVEPCRQGRPPRRQESDFQLA